MSGVMNQCWVFSDLPSEVNLFFCYALTVSLSVKPCKQQEFGLGLGLGLGDAHRSYSNW